MTARQHHYVPQCYLRGFVHDRQKPKLFVVDLKERRSFATNPKNIAVERDFHAIDVEGLASDAFENQMSKFETDLDNALKRIIAARSIRGEDDRDYLLNLIGLMAAKNPNLRESFRIAHQHAAKVIMDMATATPEIYSAHLARAKLDGFVAADASDSYVEMRKFLESLDRGEYRIETLPSMHVPMEMRTFEKILPLIFQRKWMLFKAPPNAVGFITSDHPMCLRWDSPAERGHLPPPGLAHTNTQLLFPISNDLALIGGYEVDDMEADADERLVAQINGSILLHANRQIYAQHSNFSYMLKHSTRTMFGTELLDDLATASTHYQVSNA